jgi:hypothetical protein
MKGSSPTVVVDRLGLWAGQVSIFVTDLTGDKGGHNLGVKMRA